MDGVGGNSALFATLPKSKIILKQKVFKKGKEKKTSSTSSTESSGKSTSLPIACSVRDEFLSAHTWAWGKEGPSEELQMAGLQRYDVCPNHTKTSVRTYKREE